MENDKKGMKPVLFGCAGPVLLAEERAFFHAVQPYGFVLFKRNCLNPAQTLSLTTALRESVGRQDTPIFIDQEGERVARLKPPEFPALLPDLRKVGKLFEKDVERGFKAARLHASLTASLLLSLGIDGNFAPVLDLSIEGASNAIGTRAMSGDPAVVSTLGRVMVETYLDHGVMPVIKHMPGHGRVVVDPHEELPFVDCTAKTLEEQDFLPFKALADAPAGMNCHVVFRALDPDRPVSLSAKVHREIIRGALGFKGLLFSDDLGMGALHGAYEDRALTALQAGADVVLHCSGDMEQMVKIVEALPAISEDALARSEAAQARRGKAAPVDLDRDRAYFDELIRAAEGPN